jgi:DNA polymerase
MPILHRDFETRSAENIKHLWRYATHSTTSVLCVCYAVDDSTAETWIPADGKPPPEVFCEAARNPDWYVAAHNDAFETAIEEHLLGPRYGWPLVPIERHICTMAMALALALPGSLETLGERLQLPVQKDADGAKLMRELSRPRKPQKGENKSQIYWVELTPERLQRLCAYCCTDVEVERALFHRLPRLSLFEQRIWSIDAHINRRGFHVDLELATAAREIIAAEKKRIDAEIETLSAGTISGAHQRDRILEYVNERGHNLKKLNKAAVSAALAKGREPDDESRQMLELRRAGAHTSPGKLNTLFASVDADSRIRHTLNYHRAHTGRWGGAGFQAQNLPRPSIKDIDAAVAAIMSDDLEAVRKLGNANDVVASTLRAIICAAPGMTLLAGDFSAIESRVLAWLANETWKLQAYRDFDRTGDPKFEPYCVIASRRFGRTITPTDEVERGHGKLQDLSLGFGGSHGAWRGFVPNDERSDAEIVAQEVTPFRQMHPATMHFWGLLHRTILECVRLRQPVRKHSKFFCEFIDGTLQLVLPSGRRLFYPDARLAPNKRGGLGVRYDIAENTQRRGDAPAWHGIFVENIVSGIARDLLANALVNAEDAGLAVVLHVHDEAVVEVPQETADNAREAFHRALTTLPAWAAGLPFAAKIRAGQRYSKSSAAPIEIKTSDLPQEEAPLVPKVDIPTNADSDARSDGFDGFATEIEGRDYRKINCPFHEDKTPSCQLYADGHYHCFGCGAHGWIDEDMDLGDDVLARVANARDDTHTLERGLELWDEGKPIAGTLAARYLTDTRKLDLTALPVDIDAVLRFHPRCPFGANGARYPCLLALFRDVESDAPAGIHRIGLTPNASKIKRLTLGCWPTPRAIKLWPITDKLTIGEGIETVAAAIRCSAITPPAWAMGPKADIARFPVLPGVKALTVLVDRGDPAALDGAETCIARYVTAGIPARWLRTIRVKDFNDLVLS